MARQSSELYNNISCCGGRLQQAKILFPHNKFFPLKSDPRCNVKHFYGWYKHDGGQRSYTWVKSTLQSQGLVPKAPKRGAHRKRRERSPIPGMMLHQDGSTHEWVPGKKWDLIVTMDDATNEHSSMSSLPEEGTKISVRGVKEIILKDGLFSSLYTDRGSHYWYTPDEGGKVSKTQLTQFGRAMRHLGIEMIPSYSPEHVGGLKGLFAHQDFYVWSDPS